ncbi:hypothetical protein [Parabacteroides gordonii]|uniref:hypothetical protein n=1 Tax=Parabacteroides gordonii TaxID=574930 RepID=UPI00241EE415|nr:hypothetical protein [Parabacteroides gordonii]
MKKKTVTVLAIEHSKRVCDLQPEFVDRMDVRGLVMKAYRSGYNKASLEAYNRAIEDVNNLIENHDEEVYVGVINDILKLKK